MKKITNNTGFDVEAPKEKCDDQFCPFHGKLKMRGQVFTGTVISSKMQRSAVIQWVNRNYLPKYERYINKKARITAHNPGCIDAKEGDLVKVSQCRPLSKTKNFVIIEKMGKAKEFVSKDKLYEVEERKELDRKKNREEEKVKGQKDEEEGGEE